MKMSHDTSSSAGEPNPVDMLLAKLNEQQVLINKQHDALRSNDDTTAAYTRTAEYVAASSISVPITPATESFNPSTAPTTSPPSVAGDDTTTPSAEEVLRLKAELEFARAKMARMDQELAQSRITKHTIDQCNASEADFSLNSQQDDRFNQFPPNLRPQVQRDHSWAAQDDARSDTSDALSASGFTRARGIWGHGGGRPAFGGIPGAIPVFQPSDAVSASQWVNRSFGQPFVESPMACPPPPMNFRNDRLTPDPEFLMAPPTARRNPVGNRFNNRSSVGSYPYAGSSSSFDGYTPSSTPYGSVGGLSGGVAPMGGPMGLHMNMGMNGGMNMATSMYNGYQPQPIGTPLSPHAPEFTSSSVGWKNEVSSLRTYFQTALTHN
jgi:hypothetical protein